MKKQGRPKGYKQKKNRSHNILLDEHSEYLLRQRKKADPDFNLSRYVAKYIARDFSVNPLPYLIERMNEIQEERDKKQRELDEAVAKVRKKKAEKENKNKDQYKAIDEKELGVGVGIQNGNE